MSVNETDVPNNFSSDYHVKFSVMISFQIGSIFTSLIIFTSFALNRQVRIDSRNHSLLLLLIISFLQVLTDLPMPIDFFRLNGIVQPATSAYCIWWIWYEFSLNKINITLMAWISVERHLLIFHSPFIQHMTAWKRRALHIGPLVVCVVWGPMFYLLTVIISPMCVNTRYFDQLLCGLPCYLSTNWGTFDLFVDVIAPIFIIFLSNLALFSRVIHQEKLMTGRVTQNSRSQRKMASQLALISILYLIVWLPVSIVQLGEIYISRTFLSNYLNLFNFLLYFVPLLLPVIYLVSTFQAIKQMKQRLFPQRNVADVPPIIPRARANNLKQSAMIIANTGV